MKEAIFFMLILFSAVCLLSQQEKKTPPKQDVIRLKTHNKADHDALLERLERIEQDADDMHTESTDALLLLGPIESKPIQ